MYAGKKNAQLVAGLGEADYGTWQQPVAFLTGYLTWNWDFNINVSHYAEYAGMQSITNL